MKKIILTVALLSGLIFANAQTATSSAPADKATEQRKHLTPDERAEKDVAWAQKQLGINAEQSGKWKAASLERSRANESLREKLKGSTTPEERKQMREQMKSNSDKFETTVTSLLTPEQKTKFEQRKKERRDRHHMKMKNAGHGQPKTGPTENK